MCNILNQIKNILKTNPKLSEQVQQLRQLDINRLNLTGEVLADCANYLLEQAQKIVLPAKAVVDIVGTGGDGCKTFNISTVSALVAAASGVTVAKHGNHAATSASGSMDCLAVFGVETPDSAAGVNQQLNDYGVSYIRAPYFHPVLKNIASARAILAQEKIKTIFNILGPLLNPAEPDYAVIGVYQSALLQPMSDALRIMNKKRALVLHCAGMDEAGTMSPTEIVEFNAGKTQQITIDPAALQLHAIETSLLLANNAAESAAYCMKVLENKAHPGAIDTVALNAALAIYCAHADEPSLQQAIMMSHTAIASGAALQKLNFIVGSNHA